MFYDGNFDPSTTDPLTTAPVASVYKEGETWESKFPVFSSSYEECRAELVGIYLCTDLHVQKIFGHEGDAAQDIIYINWLNMARAGLMALEFYRPNNGSWGQAHMQARFAILRVMLEAGEGFVTITPHEEKGVVVTMARDKILSVGRPAIEAFLLKIQVYKSTANYDAAKAMYVDNYTRVPEDLLALREIVLSHKKERPLFVQPHLGLVSVGVGGGEEEGGKAVILEDFPPTVEGLISSFKARYPPLDMELLDLWRKDRKACQPLHGDAAAPAKKAKA